MSSRKRKNSVIPERDGNLFKRAILLANLWHSQVDAAENTESHPSNPSSPIYRIKAIIGERPGEYLIDWADNSITGENFKPAWRPKTDVNAAAIKIWEEKRLAPFQNSNSIKRPNRQRQRRGRPRTLTSPLSIETSAKTKITESQIPGKKPSHQPITSDSEEIHRDFKSFDINSPSIHTSGLPEVIVQISPQSSFKKDLYTAYQSPLSTHTKPSSLPQHPDSGLGKTSPEPDVLSPSVLEKDRIVPDSQSLPGSPSYISPSGTSPDLSSAEDYLPASEARTFSSSHSKTTFAFEQSSNSGVIIEDSVEKLSILEIAESQLCGHTYLKSKSKPISSSRETSSLSLSQGRLPSQPRTISSPLAFYSERPQRQQLPASEDLRKYQSSHGKVTDDSSYPNSPSPPSDFVEFTQPHQTSAAVQVRRSIDALPEQSEGERDCGLSHSLGFQSQVPLAFAGQGARVTTISSKDPWQAGQLVSKYERSDSQISSGITERNSRQVISRDPKSSKGPLATVNTPPRLNTATETSVISEDSTHHSHPSHTTTTDDSALSIRDPDLQSAKQSFSEEVERGSAGLQGPERHTINVLNSTDLENLILPRILDSKEPPQAPPIPTGEMSETLPDKSILSGGSQPLGIREKLKKIREAGAAKREAQHRGRGPHSQTPPAQMSPTVKPNEQQIPQPPVFPAPPYQPLQQRQQSQTLAARGTPILPRNDRRTSQMSVPGPYQSPNREELCIQVQSPRSTQSSRVMRPASAIPDKLPLQSQGEPSRLQVQQLATSNEIPIPVRHSQSLPHTPTTPSKLSMHKEASPAQTVTLQPRWLSQMEFIIPLSMQPRILSQYLDTIEYYRRAIKKNLTNQTLSRSDLDKLNELLGRLANVSTHIGLEGGGPGSQEEILLEQEALYAEISSEKFNFLGHLFTCTHHLDVHVALVAKPGYLLDIIEIFLKGKKVRYNRPDTRTRSDPQIARGRMEVSLIPSGEFGALMNPRTADLVVALDETFKATEPQVVALRKHMINIGQLAPVIRLVVYSSVEHLDLCFQPTLDPIDRIRKLIFCVWHTQRVIGQLESHEPFARSFAEKVAAILQVGDLRAFWNLPRIAPIENIPAMESELTLSDPLSETAMEELKPEGGLRYWPNPAITRVAELRHPVVPGAKRPFDLDYGDTLEVQAKKQKMAARAQRGLPGEEPATSDNIQRLLMESKEREQHWLGERALIEKENQNYKDWAEHRQRDFEELRDKHSILYHENMGLKAELAMTITQLERARGGILHLEEERDGLKQEIKALHQRGLEDPDAAVAARAREAAEIRTLQAEVASLKKKNENLSNESATVRGVYQQATSTVDDLTAQVQTLEGELGPLRRRVEELENRRKEDKKKDSKMQLVKEIENLRVTVKSRERLVMKKEEEIKDLKRGRGGVQTRGSSQAPRSPRGGAGSRGVSPTASMLAGEEKKGPSGLRGRLHLDG